MSRPAQNAPLAALLMSGAMLCLVTLDTILKYLVADHGVGMLTTVRNLVQVVAMLALTPFLGAGILRTKRLGLNMLRGLCLVATTVFITLALAELPMAKVYSITFSAPLIATLLAVAVLGERANWRQWLCIAAGFAGVLVALNPGGPSFGLAVLYPLAMATANAVFHVLTRLMRDEEPLALVFWAALMALGFCVAALPWIYEPLTPRAWALIVVGGLFGTMAHVLMAQAFRRAPTAIVSPMVYTQIAWAALMGYLVFAEVPTPIVLFGAAVVAGSGIALIRWATPRA